MVCKAIVSFVVFLGAQFNVILAVKQCHSINIFKAKLFVITVPASITSITDSVSKNIGSTAKFECVAEANPMVPNMIVWSRDGFDMTKTKQTYDSSGKSYLTVTQLAKEDSGMFTCTADNRIGSPATKEAQLIIMCK